MKPLHTDSGLINYGGYWIGLYRSAETGTFKWVDNSPITYISWAPGQPDNGGGAENYVHDIYDIPTLKYVGWHDNKASLHSWVICETFC